MRQSAGTQGCPLSAEEPPKTGKRRCASASFVGSCGIAGKTSLHEGYNEMQHKSGSWVVRLFAPPRDRLVAGVGCMVICVGKISRIVDHCGCRTIPLAHS